jgi:hypothetical protein
LKIKLDARAMVEAVMVLYCAQTETLDKYQLELMELTTDF